LLGRKQGGLVSTFFCFWRGGREREKKWKKGEGGEEKERRFSYRKPMEGEREEKVGADEAISVKKKARLPLFCKGGEEKEKGKALLGRRKSWRHAEDL